MLSTLRRRFIVSHALPLLIVVPLMGIALIYLLEVRVLLPTLSSELTQQAALIVELVRDRSAVWSEPTQAQAFVNDVDRSLTARLMLLDPAGRLLASSDPADAGRIGQILDQPGLNDALAGQPSAHEDYSRYLQAEITDVWLPARSDQRVVGVVRLSYQLTDVYERFAQLRLLVVGVLIAGVMLGALLGWVLALNLERPIGQLTQAVNQFAGRQALTPLPEQRPEEIGLLVRAFNALVERLQTLEKARHQLLANIVHELGRPLGALQSAIQALRGGADEDPTLRRELLAGMDDELHRLRRLLDDLSGHSDQVLGTLELNRRPIVLNDWLPHVLAPWREAAQRKGLNWTVTLPTESLGVEIDLDRLGQAIGNLLSNAIKYTNRGTISIEARVDRDVVYIRVSDTGPGISPEGQAHIFEPCYRSQASRRFPQGMGLGLTIARDLVAAHGGRLEVESTPGQGSHFTISLPLQSSPN
jgi:signal transduction histidine kinase